VYGAALKSKNYFECASGIISVATTDEHRGALCRITLEDVLNFSCSDIYHLIVIQNSSLKSE